MFTLSIGEWPTPKLINSLTSTGIGGGVIIDGRGGVGGAGIDSPRLSDSPASDYLRRGDSSGGNKHKITSRGHPRPASRQINNLDASAHLLNKLNELAQGGQERV